MTQLGEAIAVVTSLIGEDWECPFSHEAKMKGLSNEMKGVGTTLGSKMESGTQTIRDPDQGGGTTIAKDLRPAKRPGAEDKPISLLNLKSGERKSFALICAAHHLIPAQASLKGCDLVPWMSAKASGSRVLQDVGYDVNGSQNGVWLPGSYAMSGKWSKMKDSEDDVSAPTDGPVSGKVEVTQFYYAICAMVTIGAQFHDAHPDYSKFVQKRLNAVAVLLAKAGHFCDKCKKKADEKKKPPPYKLVRRLNQISKAMSGYLHGGPGNWKKNKDIYTSRWVVSYITAIATATKKGKKFKVKSLG